MKKIALLATGGTIACTQTKNGLAPTLSASELAPRLGVDLELEVNAKDVFRLDSSNIQPEEWRALAREADAAIKSSDGVVITHGTDTMAYTAAALSFMLAGCEKPVILTGSQLPIDAPISDARQNLTRALLAAASGVGGVYVVFDTSIISGVRAVKTHTTALSAFSSVNAPCAGHIDSAGVSFDHPQRSSLPYALRARLNSLVLLIKLTPGLSPDIFSFVKSAGYRGVVLETFGLGGLHYIRRNLVKCLSELSAAGIIVLVVSQCLYEKADLSVYEVGREMMRENVISGRDMTTEAAVCKMMWALESENPRETLMRNIVGEFSE